jgi:UDP-glucose 4-epimerase
MKKVLVTGGAGYIGSHCVISLVEHGYLPIVVDNFSNSHPSIIKKLEIITKKKIIFYKIDLRDKRKLEYIFNKHKLYSIIHCAGLKSVTESTKNPINYFDNNLISTLYLLECMRERKIFRLIFSSSATVYESNQPLPLRETSKVGKTTNPYGTSKYMIERILMDIAKEDPKWRIRIARYFNPVGNHSSGSIRENSKGPPNNLFPYIIKVAKKKFPYLKVYGKDYKTKDGTCVRDYIHVMDIAEAHIALLKENNLVKGLKIYNFGSGKGFTVLEVIKEFENQTGLSIPVKLKKRRAGDAEASFCDASKALKELSWKATRDLKTAIKDINLAMKS